MRSFQTQHTFEQIQSAMTELDESYSLPIYYMYVEELSYAEIAQNLSISQETARQRISR
jgi:RNA polymerase sigma factor (sigma-70 family)